MTCFGINIVYHLQASMFNELSQVHRIQLLLNLPSAEHKKGTYHEVELCDRVTRCTNGSRPLSIWKAIFVDEVVHTSIKHYR